MRGWPILIFALASCTAAITPGDDAQLLPAEPEVTFPQIAPYEPNFPRPRRTFYVDGEVRAGGDGSEANPWNDLQAALCRLEPGDRLVVQPRNYTGSFRIAGDCKDGTADAPIQLFAHDAFLLPGPSGDVLTLERAHWQLWQVQIAQRERDIAGLVITGPRAHHVEVEHSHISEGEGAAVRIGGGAGAVVVSNSHIHHSGGIRVEGSNVQLINNHIHHNRSSAITIEDARDVTITGNRIQNDHGPEVQVTRASAVRIAGNRIWNCRPSALSLGAGARDITFERNLVAAAIKAIEGTADGLVVRENVFDSIAER